MNSKTYVAQEPVTLGQASGAPSLHVLSKALRWDFGRCASCSRRSHAHLHATHMI